MSNFVWRLIYDINVVIVVMSDFECVKKNVNVIIKLG